MPANVVNIEPFVAVCANDRRELDYHPLPRAEQIAAKEAIQRVGESDIGGDESQA
ncbi:MAG: hypothetical protein V3V20_06820 [Algisphaera sp.]